MPYNKLLITNLIITFAKDASRPRTSLVCRLALALAVAVAVGNIGAQALSHMVLPVDVPLRIVMVIVSGVAFTLSGLLFLMTASTQAESLRLFRRLTKLLPVSSGLRVLLSFISGLILISMLLVLGSPIMLGLSRQMQHPFIALVGAWLIGLMSGLGLSLMLKPASRTAKVLLFAGLGAGMVIGLEKIFTSTNLMVVDYVPYVLLLVLLVPLAGYVQQYVWGYNTATSSVDPRYKKLLPDILPPAAWFLVKVWRNRQSRSSFLVSLTLSLLTGLLISIRFRPDMDYYPLLLLGAILATTFCTELRGLVRRYQPPEAVLLKGMPSFVRVQLGTQLLLGLTIGMPILFGLNRHVQNGALLMAYFISLQAYGVMAGQFIGSLLLPAAGEIGSQFFAASLASTLVIAFPKMAGSAQRPPEVQIVFWLAGAMVLGGLVLITEIIRRKNYGRA